MAPKLSRRHCKFCFKKTGQKYRMEEIGDMERCLNCGAEFSVNTGALLNKTALERAAERGRSPGSIPHRVIPYRRPPSIMDPVRFRTAVNRFPRRPEHNIFHNREYYRIIIYDIPFKNLEDFSCEVINGALAVESLLDGFDFLGKFMLPEGVLASSMKVKLNNGVLEIYFKKKKDK